jgi:hypothetical protein
MWGSGTFGPSPCENGSNYESGMILQINFKKEKKKNLILYVGLRDLRPLRLERMVWYIFINFFLDVILQSPPVYIKFISDTTNLN